MVQKVMVLPYHCIVIIVAVTIRADNSVIGWGTVEDL